MSKTILIVLIILIIIPLAWYFISPIFRVKEVNEPSPLVGEPIKGEKPMPVSESMPIIPMPMVKDSLETMSQEMKAKFEEEVGKVKDKEIVMMEVMPQEEAAKVIAEGVFMPRAHEVKGKALLISHGDKKILRFEDFETINGPDLRIYLSSELGGDDYIDLGAIRATKGNVNYEVPASVDTNKYNKVLVWCVPFRVIFSYAEL